MRNAAKPKIDKLQLDENFSDSLGNISMKSILLVSPGKNYLIFDFTIE